MPALLLPFRGERVRAPCAIEIPMPASDLILVRDDGPVRTVRINRPEKKNALTPPMYAALSAALEGAARDDAVRCIVLAGGPDAFCAGNDLQDFLHAADHGGGLAPP